MFLLALVDLFLQSFKHRHVPLPVAGDLDQRGRVAVQRRLVCPDKIVFRRGIGVIEIEHLRRGLERQAVRGTKEFLESILKLGDR